VSVVAASPDGATKKDKGQPARVVAISNGESSNAYAEGMDRGGDLNIYFKYFDPEFPYDTDQLLILFPVTSFRGSESATQWPYHALITKFPALCGKINTG
jgi:hypothetical protein